MVTANQLHVSASNGPLSGCTSKEKGWGLYNIQCDFYLMMRLYIVCCILYSPKQFSLKAQPDDGLLEAETCSWLAVTIVRYIYKLIYYSCVLTFKRLLFNFVIWLTQRGYRTSKSKYKLISNKVSQPLNDENTAKDWFRHTHINKYIYVHTYIYLFISIQPLGRFSRNQNPVRRPAWLWHTASWASS